MKLKRDWTAPSYCPLPKKTESVFTHSTANKALYFPYQMDMGRVHSRIGISMNPEALKFIWFKRIFLID